MAAAEVPEIEVRSRADLRKWLAANHDSAGTVWLLHHKKASPHYVPFGDLVSELLCWGWVDSVSRHAPEPMTAHRISPRGEGSAWSAVNKAKVAEERTAGRMTPAGEAAIARAEANGMWTFLDDVERGEVPEDLAAALGPLRPVWEGWPRSVRRGTLEWIKIAKGEATRRKRIADVAESAAKGMRPSPFRR